MATQANTVNLIKFCKIGKTGQAYDIIDDYIAQHIMNTQEIIVVSGIPYLYQNGCFVIDAEGTKLKNLIKQCILQELITISRIERVYKLILCEHSLQVSQENVNCYPRHWINFKNGMLDILTGQLYEHSPAYKSVNQIPHDYRQNLKIEESTFYNFIQSRIPDKEDQQMLFEFIGYCLTKELIFPKFLILWGVGESGKSTIINFVSSLVGKDNISSLSLQELGSRFSTAYLVNKQLNTCGDIPTTALKDTAIIKQLTGEDLIKGEIKGGAIFFFRNTAKFLFSCNELPLILDEKSNGFYRRLMIIHFENSGVFIPNLHEKLKQESEIETIISYAIQGVKLAIERGKLFESGGSLGEVLGLQKESDSVKAFWDECIECKPNSRLKTSDLYSYYEEFCKEEQRQPLGKVGFFRNLRTKGIKKSKIQGIEYFASIDIRFRSTDHNFND